MQRSKVTCEDNSSGSNYFIVTSVSDDDVLHIEAVSDNGLERWLGNFNSHYIENLTGNTSSYKSFSVFVQMIRSALNHESGLVSIAIKTHSQLKTKLDISSERYEFEKRQNKRYLILTYKSDFDMVHYPLPLLHEDPDSPESMRRIIRRLQDDLAKARSHSSEQASSEDTIYRLKQENEDLKGQLLTKDSTILNESKNEIQILKERLEHAINAYNELRNRCADEIRKLKHQHEEQIAALIEEYQMAQKYIDETKMKIQNLGIDLKNAENSKQALVDKHNREMNGSKQELKKEIEAGMALKAKLREATNKLDILMKSGQSNNGLRYPQREQSRGRRVGASSRLLRGTEASTSRYRQYTSPAIDLFNLNRNDQPVMRGRPAAGLPRGRTSILGGHQDYSSDGTRGNRARNRPPSNTRSAASFSPSGRRKVEVFDPTAYESDKQEKIRQSRERKKQQVRSDLRKYSTSPVMNSGRDSWIGPNVSDDRPPLAHQKNRKSGYDSGGSNMSNRSRKSTVSAGIKNVKKSNIRPPSQSVRHAASFQDSRQNLDDQSWSRLNPEADIQEMFSDSQEIPKEPARLSKRYDVQNLMGKFQYVASFSGINSSEPSHNLERTMPQDEGNSVHIPLDQSYVPSNLDKRGVQTRINHLATNIRR